MSDVRQNSTVVDSDKLQAAIKKIFSSLGCYSAAWPLYTAAGYSGQTAHVQIRSKQDMSHDQCVH